MISNEDRINYYLNYNTKFKIDTKTINIHYKSNIVRFDKINLKHINNKMKKINIGIYKNYLQYLLTYLKQLNFKLGINILVGDNRSNKNEIIFLKTRNILDKKSIILKCFNYERHWNFDETSILKNDIPFKDKMDKVVWRGATTGSKNNKANRFTLVKKYFNKFSNINVGFTKICQNKDEYNIYIKEDMKKKDLLNYKFIIMVEGNDKASGLNWVLISNSVVMMAKPTVCSWLMEDKLIPNKHYILLKDDFSDILEKLEWALSNLDKCEEIIKNAKIYMRQFMNEENENFIQNEVIKKYIKNIV